MSKTSAWLKALRLRTIPLSLSGIIAGSAIAYFNGYKDNYILAFSLLTTVLFQIVSNLANDLGDTIKGTDNNDRIGPERAVQSGIISRREMKNAVIFVSALSIISAAILIYFGTKQMPFSMILFYSILAILCVIAAITYTIGKKAYGYHGLGDLMVLFFFGGVSVLGVYSLYAKSFLTENVLLAFGIGLLSTAVLNLNNMRDYQNDEKSGKNTLVVQMGPNMAKFYHAILILLAIISLTAFINLTGEKVLLFCLIPSIVLFAHLRKVMRVSDPADFDPELKKIALTTFAITVLLFGLIMYTKMR